ncbi:MAG: hypothetical protein J6331_02250, partial [Lentisphaeria bacterium]|nr:hypothetical protein [Lentisphaeria bacterium]
MKLDKESVVVILAAVLFLVGWWYFTSYSKKDVPANAPLPAQSAVQAPAQAAAPSSAAQTPAPAAKAPAPAAPAKVSDTAKKQEEKKFVIPDYPPLKLKNELVEFDV